MQLVGKAVTKGEGTIVPTREKRILVANGLLLALLRDVNRMKLIF